MNHITQEQTNALFSEVDRDISIKPWDIRLHRFANAAIEWYIDKSITELTLTPQEVNDLVAQAALQHEPENEPAVSLASQAAPKEPNAKLAEYEDKRIADSLSQPDVSQILEQLANEPPISGNHMARTRILLAADWYKKDQKTNTSQERVQKTAKSEQVPLTNGEIYTVYIEATNQTLRPQDERLAFAFARAIEAAHGIKEPKV